MRHYCLTSERLAQYEHYGVGLGASAHANKNGSLKNSFYLKKRNHPPVPKCRLIGIRSLVHKFNQGGNHRQDVLENIVAKGQDNPMGFYLQQYYVAMQKVHK